jgi:hypothetical protein
MLRKSNLVPNSVKHFDERKQLCRKNIKYDRSKGMLIFYICWSKTIQSVTYLGIEAERIVPIFLLKTPGKIYKYKHLNI